MAVRTTAISPRRSTTRLKQRAEISGTSIRSLIVRAFEQTYAGPKKTKKVTGPLIRGTGKLGPCFPVDQNPHDLVLS